MTVLNIQTSYKRIWQIALPVMVAGLAQNVVNFTDTAFMGHVGELELGAVGLAAIWYFIIITVAMGISAGVQILVARRLGEGNTKDAGDVVNQALLSGGSLSIVLMAAVLLLAPLLLHLMLKSDEVIVACTAYVMIRAWDIPFVMTAYIYRGFYNGLGSNTLIIWNSILIASINVALDYMLIFGHWGAPELGIEGAAYGSVIAQVVGAIHMHLDILHKKYHKTYFLFSTYKIHIDRVKRIFRVSGPMIMQFVVSMSSFFFFFLLVEQISERALAITNVTKSVYLIFMIPTWGFGAAASTIVSNQIGQGTQNIAKIVKRIALMCLVVTAFLLLLMQIAPTAVFSIYSDDARLVAESMKTWGIIVLCILSYSLAGVLLNAVIGTGATRMALIIDVGSILAYLLLLLCFHHMYRGDLNLLWSAEFIYMVLMGIASAWYIASGRWRNKRI